MYKIPVQFMEQLEERLEKMNRKATRLGVEPITYKVVGTEMVERDDKEIPCNLVEITQNEELKINGYTFKAKLERNVDEFVYKGDENVPQSQKEIRTCQHCNQNRRRNFYYILEDENGKYITVGKSCLTDFIGHKSADKIAEFFQDIKGIFDDMSDTETLERVISEPTVFSVNTILKASIYSIKQRGYYKSDAEGMSTKEDVMHIVNDRLRYDDYREAMEIPQEEVDKLKEIVLAQEPKNDFLKNLHLLLKEGYVKGQMIGYIACVPAVVKRFLEHEAKKQLEKKKNAEAQYVGTVGEKIELDVTFVRDVSFEGFYGVTTMHFFLDEDGNTIVWKTSGYSRFEVGDKYKVTGTVKEHNEYKGVKQTFLSRPRFK